MQRDVEMFWDQPAPLQEILLQKLVKFCTPESGVTCAGDDGNGNDSDSSDSMFDSDAESDLYCGGWSSKHDGQAPLMAPTAIDYITGTSVGRSINLDECLVGAGMHGGEKNVELIISTNLLDLRMESGRGNSPLSMTLEGNYE